MRQHIEHEGTWMQRRSQGKAKGYSLCENCGLKDNCRRVIGLGNFCTAMKMVVVVWSCPEFEQVNE